MPTPTAIQHTGTADIGLSSDSPIVDIGQQFNLTVTVNVGNSSPVDAVQIYMDFGPSILEAVEITAGTALSKELQSSLNHNSCQFNYAAGDLGEAVQSPLHLAPIRFASLAVSGPGGTRITFAPMTQPRCSKKVTNGSDNTDTLAPINILAT
jgi:hypothetical protein